MSTPQSAIIPDHCRAAIYIEADVNAGNESALRLSCHKALDVLAAMQKAFPDILLGLTIAFGDTSGDREMLSWADESHFEFFH